MYNDLYQQRNKFKIATEEDIQEIKDVLEYSESLIIKNQQLADSNETMDSVRESTIYVSAVLNLNDTENLDRQIIIESYEELNPYYINLRDNYEIDVVTARTTKNFRILKVMKPILKKEDEILFNTCYNESIEYFTKVIATKAFNNQEYNFEYFRILLIHMTVQKYLTMKLGYFFNIDLYDKKKLKNAFISYGFDYFDILPINYQRRLLKLINELVQSKGTNTDIQRLLKIFGFKNIDIYKYILAKGYKLGSDGDNDYSQPYLVFYKTKAGDIIDYEKDVTLNYDSVVENDPFWRCDKEDILNNREFNTITTKYMSVDLSLDIIKETMRMSYFMSFLKKMEKEFKEKQDIDFGFLNRNISPKKISIFDAITGLQSLILSSHKLVDTINKTPSQVVNIYGYNDIRNNNDIKELLEEIQILLIQKEYTLEYKRQFDELYRYFQTFNLKNFQDPLDFTDLNIIYNYYDEYSELKQQLESGLGRYSDNQAFVDYLADSDNDLIDKLEFLRVYLIKGLFELENLYNYQGLCKLFSKYLVIQGFRVPATRLEIVEIFHNSKTLWKEMKDFVETINNSTIQEYFHNNDFFAVLDNIIKFITSRRKEIKEQYGIVIDKDLYDILINDKLDIIYYKNLNAFYNVFYQPFKEIREDKKYSVDNFVDIFLKNEDLRNQLQQFIIDIDDYDLYKKFNDLFNIKMITKYTEGLYGDFDRFSDYIKYKDIDFYNWITPTEDIEVDKDKRYEFYQTRIFDLCESIDNYIGGLDLFMNHTFTGIIDFIRKILYLVITVFKSYTIDLLDTNTVLYIDDKSFNAIRTFDVIDSMTISDSVTDKISIQDVHRTFVKDSFEDRLEIKEIIRIISEEEYVKELKENEYN